MNLHLIIPNKNSGAAKLRRKIENINTEKEAVCSDLEVPITIWMTFYNLSLMIPTEVPRIMKILWRKITIISGPFLFVYVLVKENDSRSALVCQKSKNRYFGHRA